MGVRVREVTISNNGGKTTSVTPGGQILGLALLQKDGNKIFFPT
jgi:hypothetical protein